ncbi:MAG TPA: hypothetical protein VHD32_07435 [Candidatus Didemnitutus sp.]|nr:hypothetical protein [Candidatus Didemnitutus sp.]
MGLVRAKPMIDSTAKAVRHRGEMIRVDRYAKKFFRFDVLKNMGGCPNA